MRRAWPPRGGLDVLAGREFRLLFAGHALSSLGDAMAPVAIAFAVIGLTGEASDIGFVLTANVVPFVAFVLVGGAIADRFERRRLMIVSDVLRFGAQGSAAGLVLAGDLELWHLILLQALAGTGSAFFYPAAVGLVPMVVPASRLQDANALRSPVPGRRWPSMQRPSWSARPVLRGSVCRARRACRRSA